MGSVVEYRCAGCHFSSGQLSVGWGNDGRRGFWGALARCKPCKRLGVVDLNARQSDRGGRRCADCNGLLVLFEGTFADIQCPRCDATLKHAPLGSWM